MSGSSGTNNELMINDGLIRIPAEPAGGSPCLSQTAGGRLTMAFPLFHGTLGSGAPVGVPYHVRLRERQLLNRSGRCLLFQKMTAQQRQFLQRDRVFADQRNVNSD